MGGGWPSYRGPCPPCLVPHSKLRPPLDLEKKSRLLSISLRSVISLPLLEVLEKHTCLFLEPPNIQVRAWHLHPFWRRDPGRRMSSPAHCSGIGRGPLRHPPPTEGQGWGCFFQLF